MVTSSIDRDGFHPGDTVTAYLFPSNIWKFRESQVPSASQSQRISDAISRMHGFLDSYIVARYEAISALEHRGDARSSVLASATACECMMDDVLRDLSWESGQMPKEAVKYFVEGNRIESVTQRLKKDFNGLIPGNWNINGQPVLKRYFREVARVRHRTVHAGYEPSIEEARAAIEVCEVLFDHLGEKVLKQLSKYPRTAPMIYGIDYLKDHGLFTKAVEEISRADSNELTTRFIRWRNAIERLAEGRVYGEDGKPDAKNAQVVAVVGPGYCTWYAHDTTSHKAAMIESLDGPWAIPLRIHSSG